MSWADRLGFLKYFYNVGKEYIDLFRGSITGSVAVSFLANYFGLGKLASILLGLGLLPLAVLIAIGAGWVVWRWRITHKTIEREWENDPFRRAQVDLLREIRDELRARYGDAR